MSQGNVLRIVLSGGSSGIGNSVYPHFTVKTLFPGPVDTALVYYGLSETEIASRKKIVHSAEYVAEKIVELIFSDQTKLIFDPTCWDYKFA